MSGRPYFDNLAQVIALFDDELMLELLERVRLELARRGKFDAGNYVERARRCVLLELQATSPPFDR